MCLFNFYTNKASLLIKYSNYISNLLNLIYFFQWHHQNIYIHVYKNKIISEKFTIRSALLNFDSYLNVIPTTSQTQVDIRREIILSPPGSGLIAWPQSLVQRHRDWTECYRAAPLSNRTTSTRSDNNNNDDDGGLIGPFRVAR